MTTEESEALKLRYDALHLDIVKLNTRLNDERAKFGVSLRLNEFDLEDQRFRVIG